MKRLLIFGQGYTATRLRARLEPAGWHVTGTARRPRHGVLGIDDTRLAAEIAAASHILSSVPPDGGTDPVLDRHAAATAASPAWLGYLSSTGVYGDTGGAFVDETAPVGGGRRTARVEADLRWQLLDRRVHVFRLPGIYGPGRSAFERVRSGRASRIDAGDQVFSRIHVDDIGTAIIAAMTRPRPGVYNIADDEPAAGHAVITVACRMLAVEPPPMIPLAAAGLSPAAAGFYAESRRVANGKMMRDLGVRLRYPEYRSGLRAVLLEENST